MAIKKILEWRILILVVVIIVAIFAGVSANNAYQKNSAEMFANFVEVSKMAEKLSDSEYLQLRQKIFNDQIVSLKELSLIAFADPKYFADHQWKIYRHLRNTKRKQFIFLLYGIVDSDSGLIAQKEKSYLWQMLK